MAKIKEKKNLRDISLEDLTKKISNLEEEYFKARCTHKTGQLSDKVLLRRVRRDIALAKTIFLERTKSKQ